LIWALSFLLSQEKDQISKLLSGLRKRKNVLIPYSCFRNPNCSELAPKTVDQRFDTTQFDLRKPGGLSPVTFQLLL
jgi:hypothetical protein